MGASIQSVLYWIDSGGLLSIVVFVIGALVLYYELYKTILVPRWISIFGLFSGVALITASLGFTFDLFNAELAVLLMIPLAVQEQVMALWMIFKGFNSSAVTFYTRTDGEMES
jgi:NADH:ubiquinone oxidoreductase subunit K